MFLLHQPSRLRFLEKSFVPQNLSACRGCHCRAGVYCHQAYGTKSLAQTQGNNFDESAVPLEVSNVRKTIYIQE